MRNPLSVELKGKKFSSYFEKMYINWLLVLLKWLDKDDSLEGLCIALSESGEETDIWSNVSISFSMFLLE